MVGRHALNTFGHQIIGRSVTEVAQTEDANHPHTLVDHRQPTDLELLHVTYRLGEISVLSAAMNACGHHIARRRAAGIEAVFRQAFAFLVATPLGLITERSMRRLATPEDTEQEA